MTDITPIREERLKQVYGCVSRAGAVGMSIKEIADCLGFKRVNPYLTGLLDQLVEIGWLYREQSILQTGRGLRMGWRYFVTPEN